MPDGYSESSDSDGENNVSVDLYYHKTFEQKKNIKNIEQKRLQTLNS